MHAALIKCLKILGFRFRVFDATLSVLRDQNACLDLGAVSFMDGADGLQFLGKTDSGKIRFQH